jgi:hypothetical protein
VLYQSAGESKHSRMEQTDRNKPCCISLQANQNTAGWNKLDRTTESFYDFLLSSIITSQIKANKHWWD